jgi:hypothetical protein
MKNSSGEPEGNSDYVLDFVTRDVKVGRDLGEAVPGLEAVDEVFDPRPAMHKQGLTKRLGRIDRHLSTRVSRQPDSRGPAVVAVHDRLEVVAYHVGEMLLAGADHRQQLLILAA